MAELLVSTNDVLYACNWVFSCVAFITCFVSGSIPMAQISIRLEGLDKLRFDQFARSLNNFSEPFRDAMRFLDVMLTRDARSGKNPEGGTYTRYKKSYLNWLARKGIGAGKKWLWLSGAMLRARQKRIGAKEAQIGYWGRSKQDMLANVHHKGRRDGTIPPREHVSWRKGYWSHIGNTMIFPWMVREADKAGLLMRVVSGFRD